MQCISSNYISNTCEYTAVTSTKVSLVFTYVTKITLK